ncbi:MAG: hypothetical protein AAGF11_08800 [Myxococcota bacterium]
MDMVQAPAPAPAPAGATVTPGVAVRCRYQHADSTQTLREGLAEYQAANPNLFDVEQLAQDRSLGDLGMFLAAHDACHVLFGLGTSLPDETLADTWTFVGTDTTWKQLWPYFRSEAQRDFIRRLFRDIGYGRVVASTLSTLPRVAKVMWRSRRMTRKWALYRWPDHLDVPLVELRSRYGIELV